ncbi:MAG: lipid biosynthesis B12-binding/radical SAM protein [Victivallales bacterium]|jgi:lipid biosynthesis B12-binding/radical SAM protein
MKVLLISANICSDPYVVYPLGMSVVAGALMKAGHEVKQLDFLTIGTSFERLAGAVKEFSPEIVGLSIRNIDSVNSARKNDRFFADAAKMIDFLRTLGDFPVFLGGSGFTLMPNEILNLTKADYGIAGEGEAATLELLDKLSDKKVPVLNRKAVEIPGGAFYDPEIVKFYHDQTHMIPLQTKRGCTFKCVYCTYPRLEGCRIRPRPPEEVVEDIILLQEKHNVELVYFVDSVFNDAEGKYLELLELMAKREIKIPWAAFISPYRLEDEAIDLMVRTGFCWADVGGDGASDTALKGLGKSFSFEDIYKLCVLLREKQVNISNSFVFGGPGETEESVREGIKNILSLDWLTSTVFTGIRILPGTPLAQRARKLGMISADHNMLEAVYYIEPGLDRKWLEATLTAGFRGVKYCIFPPHAKNDELQMIHRIGYSKIKNLTQPAEKQL